VIRRVLLAVAWLVLAGVSLWLLWQYAVDLGELDAERW
jgi:hypothetical protein